MNRKKRRTYTLIFLLLPVLALQGSGQEEAQIPDPREIVRKAAAAINSLKAIEYDAVYTGHGAVANYPGEATARAYAHTYDGEKVRWLDHTSRALVERVISSDELDDKTWGVVTGHLGRAGASTILWELLSEEPFEQALRSDRLEYQGAIAVAGELCHIIYQEEIHPVSKRLQRQQWYISGADSLPRRQESLSDRDGRIGVLTLTLSGVRPSDMPGPDTFDLDAPDGYSTASYQSAEKKIEGMTVGAKAPVWSAVDNSGREFGLSDLKRGVAVLDFWAEWCVPCKQAMPVLQRLHEKYSTRGVTVIGVHCFPAKGGKPPMDYIRLKKYTYRQITAGDEIAMAYNVASLPTLYVIDQSGKIAFHHIGFKQDLEADLTRIIDALIKKE